MTNSNNNKKPKEDPLKNFISFLNDKHKSKPKEIKPEMMSAEEMSNFFNQKIIPVFKKLKTKLADYNFESLSYGSHKRIGSFKISESLSLFVFKVDIQNGSRDIRISCDLRYRTGKRKKLILVNTNQYQNISFGELDKINDNFIITLFSGWFMSKDELIQKNKEWRANKEEDN